jgi:hypothetical protein
MARRLYILTKGAQSDQDGNTVTGVREASPGSGGKSIGISWDNTLDIGTIRAAAQKLLDRLIQFESGK